MVLLMVLRLEYRGQTLVPVEVEGLTPDWTCHRKVSEIERFEIYHGNQKIPLAELFHVAGDPADQHVIFEGNLTGVHWIAAHMSAGRVEVQGSAGRHVGSQMSGGEIRVTGDVGGWVGAEMRAGTIHVQGNAGHLAGAAYRGSAKGMMGGTLLIDGNAGNEVGLTMRRGVIAIGGAAGDMVGFNMIAGTIMVLGECGIRPGAGMRRGTIALLGSTPPQLLPTFRYATTSPSNFLRFLFTSLVKKGFAVDRSWFDQEFELHHGDLVSLGKGEIFLKSRPA